MSPDELASFIRRERDNEWKEALGIKTSTEGKDLLEEVKTHIGNVRRLTVKAVRAQCVRDLAPPVLEIQAAFERWENQD